VHSKILDQHVGPQVPQLLPSVPGQGCSKGLDDYVTDDASESSR
jgi:hypothetical protein